MLKTQVYIILFFLLVTIILLEYFAFLTWFYDPKVRFPQGDWVISDLFLANLLQLMRMSIGSHGITSKNLPNFLYVFFRQIYHRYICNQGCLIDQCSITLEKIL
jgi:hypothetical protein